MSGVAESVTTQIREFRLGDWSVDPEGGRIRRGDREIPLESRAMEVLVDLARHAGRVRSPRQLANAAWGRTEVEDDVLSETVSALRGALGDDPEKPCYIETVLPSGYRLVARVEGLAGDSEGPPNESFHYRVLERLGGGGMGVVYRAEDTRLRRTVALKFLPRELSGDGDLKERFLREARAAAALDHRNIAVVHDVGESPDGQMFIAMAFYDGETIKRKIERGPVAIAECLRLGAQIAHGLAKAHEHGIVHRDIKPANVMVTREGEAKIVDFGLAKLAGAETVTRSENTPGTLAYMSPEQLLGQPLDRRTDLWALGVVLYEMLAGVRPFGGSSSASTVHSILYRQSRNLLDLRPDCPPPVAALIDGLLAKEPDQRQPAEASVVAERLRAHRRSAASPEPRRADDSTAERPVVIPRPTVGDETPPAADSSRATPSAEERSADRKSLRWRLIGLVAVAALLALGGWLARDRGPTAAVRRPVHLAVAAQHLIPGERPPDSLRTALVPILEEYLAGLSGVFLVRVTQLDWPLPPQGPEPDYVLATDVERDGPSVTVVVRLTETALDRVLGGEVVQSSIDRPDRLLDRLARTATELLARELGSRVRLQRPAGTTTSAAAFDLYARSWALLDNDPGAAERESAVGMLTRAIELDPEFARAWVLKGRALLGEVDERSDPARLDEARAACARGTEIEPTLAAGHVCLGDVSRLAKRLGRTKDRVAATDHYRRALELDGTQIAAYTGLRTAYEDLGNPLAAEAVWKQLVARHPDFWASHYQLGYFYFTRGDHEAALAQYERALKLGPRNATVLYSLGGMQYYLGRYHEAALSLERSIRVRPDHRAFSNLGHFYYLLRRYDEAARAFEQAIGLHDADRIAWGALGKVYRLDGRRADARNALERAIELCRKRLAVVADDADTLTQMALYQALLGDRAASLATLDAATAVRNPESHDFFTRALIHVELGELEAALEALAEAVGAGYSKAEIRMTPELDRLRQDPRYRKIVEMPEWN